jgi:hypothetical protein
VFYQGGPLHPEQTKSVKGEQAALRHPSRQKWLLKRVGDDIDPRFQRLDPLLATPGVNVLSRLAEQIVSTSSFAAGEPSGRTPLRDGE